MPPSFLASSVWQILVFYMPKTHRWFPLFNLMRSVGPGRCLIVSWFYLVLQCHKQAALCLFSLSKGFFVGAISLVLQQHLSHVTFAAQQSHVLTGGLTCKSCKSIKEPWILSTPSFWEWMALSSTTITSWILLRIGAGSWFLKTCFQASCSFFQLRCQTYPYQTHDFQ